MRYETAILATPAGGLVVIVDPLTGAVVASGFDGLADQQARLPQEEQARGFDRAGEALRGVADAVAAYADGELTALDRVVVDQPGGEFMQKAWAAQRGVRPGTTVTYAELAALAGNPRAIRAAGSSCARNRVAPFVPCHRILRSDGSLGGYYYGLEVKTALLRYEGALLL